MQRQHLQSSHLNWFLFLILKTSNKSLTCEILAHKSIMSNLQGSSVPLKQSSQMWSLNQQHQYCPWTSESAHSQAHPKPTRSRWGWVSAICVLITLRFISMHAQVWVLTSLEYFPHISHRHVKQLPLVPALSFLKLNSHHTLCNYPEALRVPIFLVNFSIQWSRLHEYLDFSTFNS